MPLYECIDCPYKTTNKKKYDNHLNRRLSCKMTGRKLHGNAKKNGPDIIICEHCGKSLASNFSLGRHIKSQHSNIIGNDNIQENNRISNANVNGDKNDTNVTNGNKNNIVKGDENDIQIVKGDNVQIIKGNVTNINTTNHNTIINNITTIMYPYYYYDILNFPLFGQYLIVTDEESPHRKILDCFNLNANEKKYHNMRLPNLDKKFMDVYGDKWVKGAVKKVINKIIISHKDVLYVIINRFRIFINTKTMKILPRMYYEGFKSEKKLYNDLADDIKLHLYNNRNEKFNISLKPPSDPNDKIFKALANEYTWEEVENTITEMDALNINFNDSIDSIKEQLIQKKAKRNMTPNLYEKIIIRIDKLIDSYDKLYKNSDEDDENSDALLTEDAMSLNSSSWSDD